MDYVTQIQQHATVKMIGLVRVALSQNVQMVEVRGILIIKKKCHSDLVNVKREKHCYVKVVK